jgi:hypothetical protein
VTFIPQMGGGGGGGANPPPAPVEDWTIIGSMGLTQIGTSILAQSANPNVTDDALMPIPEGVAPGGPWAVTLLGTGDADNTGYPSFGVVVSDGLSSGASHALFTGFYQFSNAGYQSVGVWLYLVNSQTRPGFSGYDAFEGVNNANIRGVQGYRLVCDGTNYLHQMTVMYPYNWRTFFLVPVGSIASAGLGTVAYFGFSLGSVNGPGNSTALISALDMAEIPQQAIVSMTTDGVLFTVTTESPHKLVTGASVTITGVVSSTGTPNGFWEGRVVVVTDTIFTVPVQLPGGVTYISGGLVTKVSS